MLRSLLAFTVTTVSIFINGNEGNILSNIDISEILKGLNQQQQNQIIPKSLLNTDEGEHFGSLKPNEVLELIKQGTEARDENNRKDKRQSYEDSLEQKGKDNKDFAERKKNRIKQSQQKNRSQQEMNLLDWFHYQKQEPESSVSNEYLHELKKLNKKKKIKHGSRYSNSKTKNSKVFKKEKSPSHANHYDSQYNTKISSGQTNRVKKNKRLEPNDLIDPIKFNEYQKRETSNDLDDYSKIFVILNPQAIQKSKHAENLNRLISRILASSSVQRGYGEKKSEYKGFFVMDDFSGRRLNRESKEMYNPNESMEERPKRPRSDFGGSGRTAIPYIRQRGDIYERD